ncbi:MAG: hypothetical protein FJ145_22885 [Deltaproteobacteria bacterium]|nr:hypothetical protein [Deltaproteobacteria bacterium]
MLRVGKTGIDIVSWIALSCVVLFYLGLNSGTWFISPDSTQYVEGARSLATLRGYVSASGASLTFFPPGTSALYALAAILPSGDYFYFNLLTKLLVLAYIGLSFFIARRYADTVAALLLLHFLALSQTVIEASTYILSDPAFSAMLMLTIWQFSDDQLDNMSPRSAAGLGLMLAACYALRTTGLFVFLAYVTCIFLRARHSRMKSIGALALAFMVVALPVALLGQRGEYSYFKIMLMREPWFADSGSPGLLEWGTRIAINLKTVLSHIYYIFSNDRGLRLSGVVICVLMALGFVVTFVQQRVSLHVTILSFYVAALLAWESVPRLIIPIIPVLALLAFTGARWITHWPKPSWARGGLALTLTAVICISPYWWNGYSYAQGQRAELARKRGEVVAYQGHEAFLDLVRQNAHRLTRSDVVATMHANILRYFLRDGVKVWPVPLTVDPDKSYREIREAQTTYLYCDKKVTTIWKHVEPMIRRHAAGLELVAENGSAVIYRVRTER